MKFISRSFSKIGDFDFINLDYVWCQYELVQAHHVPAHIVYLHYARISSIFLDYSGETWSLRYLCKRLLSALCCGLIKVTIPVYQERERRRQDNIATLL